MRYLKPLKWFLGIQIKRDRNHQQLSLNQGFYIDKIVSKFNISLDTKSSRTPLPINQLIKSKKQATPQEIHAYQQRVEFINFAAVIIRSDVAHVFFKFSEFFINPSQFHLECIDRVLRYLGHFKHLGFNSILDH